MSHPIAEPTDNNSTPTDLTDDELAAASGGAAFNQAKLEEGPGGPSVSAVVF